MSVGVRQRLTLPSSVQVFPLLACAVGIVLIVTAAIVRYVDRSLVFDAPVPEPTGWFVPVQAVSAAVWAVASLAVLHRRDLAWSRLAALASLSHASPRPVSPGRSTAWLAAMGRPAPRSPRHSR